MLIKLFLAFTLIPLLELYLLIEVGLIIGAPITLALVVVIYFNNGGLLAVLLVYILGKVVGAVGVTGLALLEASRAWGPGWWRVPVGVLAEQRRSLLTFAFSTNFSGSISLVAKDSESLWVSAFLGTTTAGYVPMRSSKSSSFRMSTEYPLSSRACKAPSMALLASRKLNNGSLCR